MLTEVAVVVIFSKFRVFRERLRLDGQQLSQRNLSVSLRHPPSPAAQWGPYKDGLCGPEQSETELGV